jgi:hypothetical protein
VGRIVAFDVKNPPSAGRKTRFYKVDLTQPSVDARIAEVLAAEVVDTFLHLAFLSSPTHASAWAHELESVGTMHVLNACNSNQSALWQEGLANFFLDDLYAYEALLIIPSAALQEKLQAILGNKQSIMSMHQPLYNMLAYPFSEKYENSNQWALELFAMAMSQQAGMNPLITSRKQAQQWLKLTGYEPSTLKLDTLTRLGARMFKANVAFDDHPDARRFANLIDTVTVESIAIYIKQVDGGSSSEVVR